LALLPIHQLLFRRIVVNCPCCQTLSLIGGDLHLTSEIPLTADNSFIITPVTTESILAVEHGRINLASLASHGEVIPSENDLILQGQGGQLTVENTLVELSGNGGGAVFIRAGQFFLDNAIIRSNTLGNQEGKDINLKITEAAYLNGINSEISVTTTSTNNAGGIFIDTPYLEITSALINTGAVSAGFGGPVEIHANQISLRDGAFVASGATGTGRSGNLTFNITGSLSISGFYPGFRFSHGHPFENTPSMIFSLSLGNQQSGNIWVNAQELNLNQGGILTNAYGTGQGGNITIQAQAVRLVAGGLISSSTYQVASAGNIKIQVAGQLYLAGWAPVAQRSFGQNWVTHSSYIESGTEGGTGKGGIVDIQADEVIVTEDAEIGADSSMADGAAGEILIRANTLQLTKGGIITTSAQHAGGGDIRITVANQLYLHHGQITTSVVGGTEDSGNVTIEKPQFVVMNHGKIIAQADEGHGGDIRIVAEQLIKSSDSLISASSRLGVDGNVDIDSPEESVSDSLVILSGDRIDAAAMMKKPCSEYVAEEDRSHFYVNPINGVRPAPHDRQGSNVLPASPSRQTEKMTMASSVTECQKNTVKSEQNTSTSLF